MHQAEIQYGDAIEFSGVFYSYAVKSKCDSLINVCLSTPIYANHHKNTSPELMSPSLYKPKSFSLELFLQSSSRWKGHSRAGQQQIQWSPIFFHLLLSMTTMSLEGDPLEQLNFILCVSVKLSVNLTQTKQPRNFAISNYFP